MMGHMGNLGFGGVNVIGFILGLLVLLVILAGLVVLVIWAVRHFGKINRMNSTPVSSAQSPKEIVQARYARGEINREEYQQLINDLGN
jgi:putative membrane protein